MTKRLVKFPGHVAFVRLQCPTDGYESLMESVENHRYAKGEVISSLYYQHKLTGGDEVPVEIDNHTIDEITTNDVIHVEFSFNRSPRESTASSTPHTLRPQHANKQPPLVPKLHFDLTELRHFTHPGSGSSTRQKEILNTPIQTVDQAMKYLQHSTGRMEAVKVPRFFRSINCPFSMEDLWQQLRSRMGRDGFIDHQILLKMITQQSDPPIAIQTPRTCISGRDVLPLGASAVSPLPAGKSINDILQQYESDRSRSNSRDRKPNNTSHGSHKIANTYAMNGCKNSYSSRRLNGFTTTTQSENFPPVNSSKILWEAYELLTSDSSGLNKSSCAKLQPSHLDIVLAGVGIEESPEKIAWVMNTLRITEGRYLSKKDVVLIMSELQGIPPEKAHPRAVSKLSILVNTQPTDNSLRIPQCMNYSPFGIGSGRGGGSGGGGGKPVPETSVQRRSIRRDRTRTGRQHTQSLSNSLLPRRSTDASDYRQLPLKCAFCCTELDVLQTVICGSCRLASYCSEKCLSEDWPLHEPICRIISRHSNRQKMSILCGDDGAKFHVRTCPTDGSDGLNSDEEPSGDSYLFIVSQRVPHVAKVFVVFVSADGNCDYTHPGGCDSAEATIHDILRQIFEQVFAEAIHQRIWTLAACCLLPLRAFYCKSESFSSLVRDYLLYFTTFIAESLSTKVCHSNLGYNLIVPPLETLCEAFESRALQVSSENNTNDVFLSSVTNAKDYYLLLLSFLQDTTFTADVQNRAVVDRRRIMRKISIVYQHLAARDKEGRVMSYLKRSETVLLRLIDEIPTSSSYNQLALLYDCLPHDQMFQEKAAEARKKARDAIPGPVNGDVEQSG